MCGGALSVGRVSIAWFKLLILTVIDDTFFTGITKFFETLLATTGSFHVVSLQSHGSTRPWPESATQTANWPAASPTTENVPSAAVVALADEAGPGLAAP